MATRIRLFFAPCLPDPAQGYRVRYRPLGSLGAYTTWPTNFFASPAIFVIDEGQPPGTQYEGIIDAECDDDVFGDPKAWTSHAAAESSSAAESASASASASASPPDCAPVQFVEDSVPDAIVGEPYSYDLHLLGDAPFFIGSQTNPAWMTVTLDGNVIHLTGTPPIDFPNVHLVIQVLNCSNHNSATLDVHFDQLPAESSSVPPCEAVDFVEGSIPPAVVGEAYSVDLHLTGDAPFALGSVTKPSWMTVTLVGDVVELRGTPGAESFGDEVTIVVSNCDAVNEATFTDTIDAAEPAPGEGSTTVDVCVGDNRVDGVTWNGDPVSGDFPVASGGGNAMTVPAAGTHTLAVTIGGFALGTGRVVVVDSTGATQCQTFSSAPTTLSFPGFQIDLGEPWLVAVDCDGC